MNTDERITTEETIAVLSQFRDLVYGMFSRIFREELDKTALDGVRNILGILDQSADLAQFYRHKHFQEGQKRLDHYFDQIMGGKDEEITTDLARSFASLFLGVGPQTIGLCESVYKSEQGLLYQSSHFEAQQAYQKIEMVKSDDFHEPADHIAVELSYMAQLCRLIHGEVVNGGSQVAHHLGLQKAFCAEHLLSWVPDFTQRVIDGAQSPFYCSIGYLLNGFIADDDQLIDMLLKEVG